MTDTKGNPRTDYQYFQEQSFTGLLSPFPKTKPDRITVMKPLRWPTTVEQAAYLKERQRQNMEYSRLNRNENWFLGIMGDRGIGWTRQALWGYRIFDFWNGKLGIAVEIDGPEHRPEYDAHRDEYNFRRSGIVVLRVRNGNEEDAARVLGIIPSLGEWDARRFELGIQGTKKSKRRLLGIPRFPSLLEKYLKSKGW